MGRCKNWWWIMPFSTMARGLIGIFLRGADLPATNQRAKTPPVQFRTYLSLRAILAAGAGGRGAWGGAIGCKDLREEGGRNTGEGGRNRKKTGWPRGEAETGGATTRRRTPEEKERGIRGHGQVSSDGDRGEHRERRDSQEESNNAREVWSGETAEDLAGSETEEEGMTTGGV